MSHHKHIWEIVRGQKNGEAEIRDFYCTYITSITGSAISYLRSAFYSFHLSLAVNLFKKCSFLLPVILAYNEESIGSGKDV